MQEFITLVSSIPASIWGAIGGAIIALCGVFLTHRGNTNRLRIQLAHDSAEKAKERIAGLRKDIYLKTVEELTKANAHLASLPNKDPTKGNLADELQGFFTTAAKLQLVAEPKTALLVNELVSSYGELVLKGMGNAMPLHRIRGDIAIFDDLYNQAYSQVLRVLGEMAKFNETARVDDRVMDALQRSFTNFNSQATKHAEDRKIAWANFNRLNIEYGRLMLIEIRKIGVQQIPVQVEIRRDLGLVSDLDVFQAQMEKQWQKMSAQFDILIGQLGNSQ